SSRRNRHFGFDRRRHDVLRRFRSRHLSAAIKRSALSAALSYSPAAAGLSHRRAPRLRRRPAAQFGEVCYSRVTQCHNEQETPPKSAFGTTELSLQRDDWIS